MNVTAKRCGACSKALLNERRDYCDGDCKRDAAYTRERLAKGTKSIRKRRLRTSIAEGVRNGGFSSNKSVVCKLSSPPNLGAVVRGQIEGQGDQQNPVSFDLPDGTRCGVWLANSKCNRIVGDERWWCTN